LVRWGRRRGVRLSVVVLDDHAGVIQYARDACRQETAITVVRGDGLYLPVGPRSFDVVVCSTMLHHLEWEQGVRLVRSMVSAARMGLIVNDLRRGRGHYWGARLLLTLLARNRVTRHDGPLSVLRAYNVSELRRMALEAGVSNASVTSVLGYRMQLVSSV
jgi:2-polyprenyl-3-methyl-5-hydroxy-6-metoxy-1,4-benzoquinol methylase